MEQEKVGRCIAAKRRELGLTQEQLGERLGVTNKTVFRWETGKYMPDIDKLQALSVILGISINELLAGKQIENVTVFAKESHENLAAVLSRGSAFSLQDRIAYFKHKWIREHKALIIVGIILWCVLLAFGIYMKQPIVLGSLPIAGLLIYAYIRNQMMIYVEGRAFGK